MKKWLVILIMLGFLSSCSEDRLYPFDATITGPDYRMCMCCGGWFITIGEDRYRFYELPERSGIDLNTADFPVEVKLKWELDNKGCIGDEIFITRIKEL